MALVTSDWLISIRPKETFRDNDGNHILHSFDSLNNQENWKGLHSHMQANCRSDEQSFNEQVPSHLASKNNSDYVSTVPAISCHIQATEFSDDFLRECVRSF